jgi:LacI family transcriptional regulator
MNGTPVVSPKHTERVREAIVALDYHPDGIARSLRTGRTHVIGVVIPDITNPFFADVVRGMEDAAASQNYSVIVCNTNEDAAQEALQLKGMQSRRADGLIISCSKPTSRYDSVLRRGIPVVFLDQLPNETDAPFIKTDNFGGAYAATQHLIELGHQRIALLSRSLELRAQLERVDGYRKAMQLANLPIRDEYFRTGGVGEEDGYAFGLSLLRLERRPTAVFSCNNKMLAGLLRAMGELALVCPDDMSVVGFDDHIWMRCYRPPITTVWQRSYEVGHSAMTVLLQQIAQGSTPVSSKVILPCELIVRSSSSFPPS